MNKRLLFSTVILGLSAIVIQIVMLREFMANFYGNELVFGIVFGNWLLFTGIGAYYSRIKNIRQITISKLFLAILPFLMVLAVRSKDIVFKKGIMFGIDGIFFYSFITVPYCILIGMTLTGLAKILKTRKIYLYDNIGSIIGGLLFLLFSGFNIIFAVMALNILSAYLLSNKKKILPLFILVFAFTIDFDFLTTPYDNLFFTKFSKYGKVAVTMHGEEISVFSNGQLMYNSNDISPVHLFMVYEPDDILLVSGGHNIAELAEYDVNADYVEIDPLTVEVMNRYVLGDEANAIEADARMYISRGLKKYDMIIIDLPGPVNAQLNRFYSVEFYRDAKRSLAENGIIVTGLEPTENYISEEAGDMNSIMYNTLKENFENVLILPADMNYFIASDSDLDADFSLAKDYEYFDIRDERIDFVMSSIDENAGLNTDFRPIGYYYQLKFWLSKFNYGFIVVLALALLLIRKKTFQIFTTGFASSAAVVILLISYQIIYGYVYNIIALLVALFMIGIVTGTFIARRIRYFSHTEMMIIVFFIVLGLSIEHYNSVIIYACIMVIGALTSMQFILKSVKNKANELFLADYLGSFLGALLVCAFMIPLWGIQNVIFIIAAVKLLSLTTNYIK